jgi:phage baseplate assembly protein W
VIDIVKPVRPPNVTGSSIFSSGFGFNTFTPQRKQFALLANFDSIRDNIRNIIFFRKGDYPDNPDFGIGLQDYLFEQADEVMRIALNQETRRQISRYEPRVVIRSISVSTPSWADDAVVLDIDLLVNNIQLSGAASASGGFSINPTGSA